MRPIWTGYITGDQGTSGIAMIWGKSPMTVPTASTDNESEKFVAELVRENKELYRENEELAEINRNLRREYKSLMKRYRERLG